MAGWWAVVMLLVSSVSQLPAFSDPQTNFLGSFSGKFKLSDVSASMRALNVSFADLRNQLSRNNKRFAIAQHNPMYAMVQCRNYLSSADCVACFDAAVLEINRNFYHATGVLVIFDGCFVRYEDSYFYDQKIDPISGFSVCGKRTASKQDIFNMSAQKVLNELLLATPRINGFYAAAKQGSGGGATIYGVAQCAETVTQSWCQDCLATTYKNIQGCLPQFADGRGVDAGCFLRYSDTPFFADNQTIDITPFLGGGIGNILGATQLRGSKNYKYKDLKAATKDFSDENKLGKGGFGDVCKGTLKNGNVVAVKKLATISNRVKADFLSEVSLITNVHHPNLINLLGYSGNGKVLLLVYEYMANTSLDRYIYETLIGRRKTRSAELETAG